MPIRVDGQLIPVSAILFELDRLVRFYSEHLAPEELENQMPLLRKRAREQAIGAKLLIDEAGRLDIKVPGADIERRLEIMIKRAGGREKFDSVLKAQKMTEAGVRAGIEQGRRVDLLIERITAGLDDPTEAEMQAHFDQHTDEFMTPERAQAQHILVKPASDSADDRRKALERITQLRHRIQQGDAFSDMASAYSDCPSGKKTGGSLGWFGRGMMVPEFDQAVFSMEIGALSEIISTTFGYHIIQKTGHEPAQSPSFADVRDKVRDFLRHVRRGEAISARVRELHSKAVVEDTPDPEQPDRK
jgi:parvulin-like peptidyl-prolyl isomerase